MRCLKVCYPVGLGPHLGLGISQLSTLQFFPCTWGIIVKVKLETIGMTNAFPSQVFPIGHTAALEIVRNFWFLSWWIDPFMLISICMIKGLRKGSQHKLPPLYSQASTLAFNLCVWSRHTQ
jgi:hypothetical protein